MQKQTERWIFTGAAAALAVFLTVPAAFSQNDAASSGAAPSAQAQNAIQMVPALATLDKGLDAKKVKQGDVVTAKLQKDIASGTTQIPKNSVLVGHVDQVQPSQSKSDSTVVVTFDQAKLKNGQQIPIKATVMAIAAPVNLAMQANDDSGGSSAMPSGGMAGHAAPSGGSGGSSAASGGGSSSAASAPPPQPMSTPDMPTTPSGQQGTRQQAGIPGVTLKSDIHQQNSATFTASGKNVHLPDGMQMQMALAVIPAGVKIQ